MMMMSFEQVSGPKRRGAVVSLALCALLSTAGCKSTPVVDDAALSGTVQSRLAGDGSLAGLPIQPGVQSGVVTLNGTVSNTAQRELAAKDVADIAGVKTVVNNLTVLGQTVPPVSAAATTRPVAPVATIDKHTNARVERESSRPPAPIERREYQAQNQAPPPPMQPQQAPAPPPQPTFRDVTIPAGTTIPVRVTQTLDSATSQAGDSFSGAVASDIVIDGNIAIVQGANVSGRVDAVQEAAHFKGSSLLTVSLTNVKRMPVSSEPYTVEGKGRGKNTAEKTGIGAAGGAILGGIFGGGKGAAIGAAAGGGLGAGSNAVTRGQQVQIPSETVVRFRTTSPITVRVQPGGDRRGDGELRQHGGSQ